VLKCFQAMRVVFPTPPLITRRMFLHTHHHKPPRTPLVASDPVVQTIQLPCSHDTSTGLQTIAYTRETFISSVEPQSSPHTRPIVLCVHGTLGSHRDFRYLAGACSQMSESIKEEESDKSPSSPFPADMVRVDLPGYGASLLPEDRQATPTDSAHYASTLWQFLDTLYPKPEGSNDKRRFILLGHSLAGHVVMEMAASRPNDVLGVAFLASIGTRPHKGVGGPILYPWFSRLGNFLDHPHWGSAMKRALHSGYVYMGGFSKKNSMGDVIHSHRRIAALDFPKFQRSVVALSAMSNKGESIHSLVAYANNDPHIEVAIPEELSRILPGGPRLVFKKGGHNIQKTKSIEIAAALKSWIEDMLRNKKIPQSNPND
jgi:pimeloyl-ACP methyl ester carboxylesterase